MLGVLVLAGVAFGPGCSVIRRDFDSFESGFNSAAWRTRWKRKYLEPTVSIHKADDQRFGFVPSLDGRGGDALRVTIPAGAHEGTFQLQYVFKDHAYRDPEEATVSYLIRFASDFTPAQPGKLPGFAGTYDRAGWGPRVSDGFNGWSARGMFYPAPNGEPLHCASLCYLADMKSRGGSSTFYDWHKSGVPMFERDRWYHIVQHVRMNSVSGSVGQADGVLQVWVDGQLAVDQHNVVYRHSPELRIDRMWFNIHYGGDPAPTDYHVFLDEIIVHAGPPGTYVKRHSIADLLGDNARQSPMPRSNPFQ
ncbi:MAG: hypothetical protein D6695_01530 [Planctomycetota bacterium]|nr:MAG: hypothetical protein D6695_01530 [Planctomycetota bacterium]